MPGFLHGVEHVELQDGPRPITVLRSSIIGLVGTFPKGAVGETILITGSRLQAERRLGAYVDTQFSGLNALDAIFAQYGAMVVCVNALDPANTGDVEFTQVEASPAAASEITVTGPNDDNPHNVNIVRVTLGGANLVEGSSGDYTVRKTVAGVIVDFRLMQAGDVTIVYTLGHTAGIDDEQIVFKGRKASLRNGWQVATGFRAMVTNATFEHTFSGDGDTFVLPEGTGGAGQHPVIMNGGVTLVEGTGYVYTEATRTIAANADTPTHALIIQYSVNGGAFIEGTDYTFDSSRKNLTITETSRIVLDSTLTASYDYLYPKGVTEANVIGRVENGNFFGIRAFEAARSKLGAVPRIIIAPGYTGEVMSGGAQNPVAAALQSVANNMQAVFLIDGPNTTDEKAVQVRGAYGSDRGYMIDPHSRRLGPAGKYFSVPSSAILAGIMAQVDADAGGPWRSPSNKIINGIVGTDRAIPFELGSTTDAATYLNENEVGTIIREDGFRTWGNRGLGNDPKYAFLVVRRTADIVGVSIQRAHFYAVDAGITRGFVESILESVNAFLRSLAVRGAIIGGTAWVDPELNTPTDIQSGNLTVDYDFSPIYPLEKLTFRARLTNEYLEVLFTGTTEEEGGESEEETEE